MFYWSSAPGMCKFKEPKDARNAGKWLLQRARKSPSVPTGSAGTHKQRLAKVKNSQYTMLALSSNSRSKQSTLPKVFEHQMPPQECAARMRRMFRKPGPSCLGNSPHMSEREPFPATLAILGRRKGCTSASASV